MVRKLWYGYFKSRLYGSHDLLVSLGRHKGNCETLCAEPASTTTVPRQKKQL